MQSCNTGDTATIAKYGDSSRCRSTSLSPARVLTQFHTQTQLERPSLADTSGSNSSVRWGYWCGVNMTGDFSDTDSSGPVWRNTQSACAGRARQLPKPWVWPPFLLCPVYLTWVERELGTMVTEKVSSSRTLWEHTARANNNHRLHLPSRALSSSYCPENWVC